MEKISIIVPVYKVEKYLDRCVESIVNQTYKNLEIILVDDGSPDNCPQMCDDWAKKDSRIKVIHKENGGQSSARNIGIENSTGEYIQFVDSDDFLDINTCNILIENMKNDNADLIIFGIKIIDENYQEKEKYNCDSFFTTNPFDIIKKLFDLKLFNSVCNKIYKRSLIKENFSLDVRNYGEDFLFNCEYLKNCNIIIFNNSTCYNYLMNTSSVTHVYSDKCFINHSKIFDYLENNFKTFFSNESDYIDKLKSYFIFSSILHVIKANSLKYKEKRKKVKEIKDTSYFKSIKFNKQSFSYKVLYILTKMNFVFTIKIALKLIK